MHKRDKAACKYPVIHRPRSALGAFLWASSLFRLIPLNVVRQRAFSSEGLREFDGAARGGTGRDSAFALKFRLGRSCAHRNQAGSARRLWNGIAWSMPSIPDQAPAGPDEEHP